MGPQAIRSALLDEQPEWVGIAGAAGIVDIGDVFVVPQLLHDDMLSGEQKNRTRAALYPDVPVSIAANLPVSPLSMTERVLDLVFALNQEVVPVVLGGDHSNAWPVVAALARVRARPWGIVQVDAHTDLLSERLGVKYCFATWSYHANELLGRNGRLLQVGTRASRFDRGHWESTLEVRQFWASECRERPSAVLDDVVNHLRASGIADVYLSNDIDGTDDAFADATGTPEPGGLPPDFVVELIRRLGGEFNLIAGDVMEVAPALNRGKNGPSRTVGVAVRYLLETLSAILGRLV